MQEIKMFFNTLSRTEFEKELVEIHMKQKSSFPDYINKRYERKLKELNNYVNDFIDIEIDSKKYLGIKFLTHSDIKNKLSKLLKISDKNIDETLIHSAYNENIKKIVSKTIKHNFGYQLQIYYRKKYYGEQTNTWWYEKGPLSHHHSTYSPDINDFPEIRKFENGQIFPNSHYEYSYSENTIVLKTKYELFNYGDKRTPKVEKKTIFDEIIDKKFKIIPVIDGVERPNDSIICKFYTDNNIKLWNEIKFIHDEKINNNTIRRTEYDGNVASSDGYALHKSSLIFTI